jgi:DNA/RNA endonuclease YhcR with UshA esterase domain
MNVAWIALLTALVALPASAAVVPASEASSHVGQSVTVEGQVSGVHTARSGKETFIDVGGAYPNQTFTAVIFQRSMAAVGDVGGLTGKTVDITGTIQTYEGKPEIIVTSRDQIRAR